MMIGQNALPFFERFLIIDLPAHPAPDSKQAQQHDCQLYGIDDRRAGISGRIGTAIGHILPDKDLIQEARDPVVEKVHDGDPQQVSRFPVDDQISRSGHAGRCDLQEELQDLLQVGKVDAYDMDITENQGRDQGSDL